MTSSQGLCETTMTERFAFDECVCGTYPENLGPCRTFTPGADQRRCVYCDHRIGCHTAIAERFERDEAPLLRWPGLCHEAGISPNAFRRLWLSRPRSFSQTKEPQ